MGSLCHALDLQNSECKEGKGDLYIYIYVIYIFFWNQKVRLLEFSSFEGWLRSSRLSLCHGNGGWYIRATPPGRNVRPIGWERCWPAIDEATLPWMKLHVNKNQRRKEPAGGCGLNESQMCTNWTELDVVTGAASKEVNVSVGWISSSPLLRPFCLTTMTFVWWRVEDRFIQVAGWFCWKEFVVPTEISAIQIMSRWQVHQESASEGLAAAALRILHSANG